MIFESAPALHADLLALRRAGRGAVAQIFVSPALLVLTCCVLAAVPMFNDARWTLLASAALALAGGHALTHQRLTAAVVRARFGWCGALPLSAHTTSGVLCIATAAALAVAALAGSLLLACVAILAPHPDELVLGLFALDGGLIVGTLAGVARALRRGEAGRVRHADGIREPLLALPWLRDSRLPHLLDWQRRTALVRWRSGSGFWLVGIVLAGEPMGASAAGVVGLVLLALVLAWLAVVMRACADAAGDARRLLGATPVVPDHMRRASLRFPLLALGGATAFVVLGALLLRSGVAMLGWIVCAAAVSFWPLLRLIKAVPSERSP